MIEEEFFMEMTECTVKMRKNFAELDDRAALIDEHGGNIL